VLNQDEAKSFLHRCDPHKMYTFFMRATQLEDCKKDYVAASEEKRCAEEKLDEKVSCMRKVLAKALQILIYYIYLLEKPLTFHNLF
jgi:hypothetical protein